jgi:hypothetical protein
MMKALLLFHFRVGVRLAVRGFTPVFSVFLIAIILQMYPVAFVTSIALSVFAGKPPFFEYLVLGALSFLFPAWAAPLMLEGLNGWVRHLPVSGTGMRRGFAMALVTVQVPLALVMALLGLVAFAHGRTLLLPVVRVALLLVSGAFAAVPCRRQPITAALSMGAAIGLVAGGWAGVLAALLLLAAVDLLAGPLPDSPPVPARRPVGPLLSARIALRALGPAIGGPYLISLVPIGAALIFTVNNLPPPEISAGATRLGGALSVTLLISGVADRLLVRRPVWPWARSLPWTAASRVLADAFLLAALAAPTLIFAGALNLHAALEVAAVVPLLALRGAAFVRQARERKTGTGALFLEGFFVAATIALVYWVWTIWLAAAPAAFWAARKSEISLKATRWIEHHHASSGDSLSWSGR